MAELCKGLVPARKGLVGGGYASGRPAQAVTRNESPTAENRWMSRVRVMVAPFLLEETRQTYRSTTNPSVPLPARGGAARARAGARPPRSERESRAAAFRRVRPNRPAARGAGGRGCLSRRHGRQTLER